MGSGMVMVLDAGCNRAAAVMAGLVPAIHALLKGKVQQRAAIKAADRTEFNCRRMRPF